MSDTGCGKVSVQVDGLSPARLSTHLYLNLSLNTQLLCASPVFFIGCRAISQYVWMPIVGDPQTLHRLQQLQQIWNKLYTWQVQVNYGYLQEPILLLHDSSQVLPTTPKTLVRNVWQLGGLWVCISFDHHTKPYPNTTPCRFQPRRSQHYHMAFVFLDE